MSVGPLGEWLLRPANDDASVTRLTLRHYDLGASPLTSANVALGWVGVLDAMKTLLETGEPLGPVTIEASPADDTAWHRQLAIAANGEAWALLGRDDLDADDLDQLLERAYAAAYHWRRAAPADAPQQARAAWLLARCHTVAGHADLALHHADRCAALARTARGAADFDHAYAHEARARALALLGTADEATEQRRSALTVEIADDEDREILMADLAAEPWFGLPLPASV